MKKKFNLDTTKIFKIDETVEYLAIINTKNDINNENIINLSVYDKFTEEIFEVDIIDYENIEKLNLDIKILNDYIYILYQDEDKIFILKYK